MVSVGTAAHTRAECNARKGEHWRQLWRGERLFLQVPSLHTHCTYAADAQSIDPTAQTNNQRHRWGRDEHDGGRRGRREGPEPRGGLPHTSQVSKRGVADEQSTSTDMQQAGMPAPPVPGCLDRRIDRSNDHNDHPTTHQGAAHAGERPRELPAGEGLHGRGPSTLRVLFQHLSIYPPTHPSTPRDASQMNEDSCSNYRLPTRTHLIPTTPPKPTQYKHLHITGDRRGAAAGERAPREAQGGRGVGRREHLWGRLRQRPAVAPDAGACGGAGQEGERARDGGRAGLRVAGVGGGG